MEEGWRQIGLCPLCQRAVWQGVYAWEDEEYCSPLCLDAAMSSRLGQSFGSEHEGKGEKKMQKKSISQRGREWIKEVEEHLYHYQIHKQLLEQYLERCQEPASARERRERRGKPGEGQGMALHLVRLGEQMEGIRWYVEAIDDLLPLLDEDERYILDKRYFAARPKAVWQIAGDIFISRSEYYRRRNLLLARFARRFGIPV